MAQHPEAALDQLNSGSIDYSGAEYHGPWQCLGRLPTGSLGFEGGEVNYRFDGRSSGPSLVVGSSLLQPWGKLIRTNSEHQHPLYWDQVLDVSRLVLARTFRKRGNRTRRSERHSQPQHPSGSEFGAQISRHTSIFERDNIER